MGKMSIARAMWEAAFKPGGPTMDLGGDLEPPTSMATKRKKSTALRFPKVRVALSQSSRDRF